MQEATYEQVCSELDEDESLLDTYQVEHGKMLRNKSNNLLLHKRKHYHASLRATNEFKDGKLEFVDIEIVEQVPSVNASFKCAIAGGWLQAK